MIFRPYRLSSLYRRAMFSFLSGIGLTYSRQTPCGEIHRLFRRLWPVETRYSLVRFGEAYLLPTGIGGIDVVFSPGVGLNSNFELTFAEKGVPCFLADGSVSHPSVDHNLFRFIKKFIGLRTENNYVRLDQWVQENYPHGNAALLQMDIEAGEYQVLLSTTQEFLRKFKVIVVEIHNLNFLTSQEGFILCELFFDHLLKNFNVCHFHTNNYIRPFKYQGMKIPSDIELTLIRKDLCDEMKPVAKLPHSLDVPSAKRKPDVRYFQGFKDGILA